MNYPELYDRLEELRAGLFTLLPEARALQDRAEIGALAEQARRVSRTAQHLSDVLLVEGRMV